MILSDPAGTNDFIQYGLRDVTEPRELHVLNNPKIIISCHVFLSSNETVTKCKQHSANVHVASYRLCSKFIQWTNNGHWPFMQRIYPWLMDSQHKDQNPHKKLITKKTFPCKDVFITVNIVFKCTFIEANLVTVDTPNVLFWSELMNSKNCTVPRILLDIAADCTHNSESSTF